MTVDARFILIHSPLVGPLTWSLVAEELRRRGVRAAVPELIDDGVSAISYWQQHAGSVARALAPFAGERLILVGHSGAGALLPAIRAAAGRPVAGYVFVDAGIHRDGASRLEMMREESPPWAEDFHRHLAAGGHFPEWSDADLCEVLPDAELRRRLVAEQRPRALAFFEEPVPVFQGWPDAPCAYLQLSAAYDAPAARARRDGWSFRRLDAGHFHMLVDPGAVTDALVGLAEEVEPGGAGRRPTHVTPRLPRTAP